MQRIKHWPFRLLLMLGFLAACDKAAPVQRRTISQTPGSISTTDEQLGDTDATYGTVDPNFNPEDPNTFSRKPGVAFPSVNFAIEGVPTGPSDRYNYSLIVKADASISHYAYKIDTSASCDKTGGYTVGEAKNPIVVSLDKTPIGPVYLCAIAFHFPSRQWQDMTKALSYKWDKIAFKRSIDSYYEFVDATCKITARINAKLTIDADKGSYVWQRVTAPGCNTDPASYTDLMSLIQVTDTTMTGAWHEGAVVAGWFKFTWSNPERTAFKGTWGYGEPGVKTEGVWNSN